MPSYCYKEGFKPYRRDISELTPRVRKIVGMLEKEQGWGSMNKIARRVGVSRCFVWQIAHRLKETRAA
jgi:DNA-binding IscR family transcriptional regulator